jgi:hypothetical protein
MKRVVLVLSLAAVVALPSAAFGGLVFPPHNSFQGRVEGDPNTYFGFNVNKKHGAVRHLAVAFPMNCYSGDHAIVHTLFGRAIDFLSSSGRLALKRPRHHRHGLLALVEDTSRIHTELGRGKLSVCVRDHHPPASGGISVCRNRQCGPRALLLGGARGKGQEGRRSDPAGGEAVRPADTG